VKERACPKVAAIAVVVGKKERESG